MALDYGTITSPTQFALGVLKPIGIPVLPTKTESMPMPCYVANAITNTGDKYLLHAIISLHTYAQGNTPQEGMAIADQWAWAADRLIMSLTMGDVVILPNGNTAECAGLGPERPQMPVFQPYRDPFIVRYYARYSIPLRFS